MDLSALAWLSAASVAAAGWAWLSAMGLRTDRSLARLPALPDTAPAGGWPGLSAVVPCRDEAGAVEAAVRSLLAQDYPDLEVVAVDDRSTDGTGAILDRLAVEAPRLAVLHLATLPAGWLGKNHACAAGAARASGEWILFTDGDVVFEASALRRAVAFAEAHRLGHLVALPRLRAQGFLERAFVSGFSALASFVFRAWELRRPGTSGFVGVGAFNLVRAADYRRAGGHRSLPLEVVDDAKLGLLLRRSGVRQGAVDSGGLVSVRWQAGLARSMAGLLKNAFAACEFRWSTALSSALAIAFLSALPLAATALAPTAAARVLGLAALAASAAVHGAVARRIGGGTGLEGLLSPAVGLSLAGVLLASAAAAALRGGVVWRGTFYPLDELRRGCLRAADWPPDGAVGWD